MMKKLLIIKNGSFNPAVREKHGDFVVNDKIWGVQFHPEFTEAIMHDVADELINNKTKQCDTEQIHSSIKENSTGEKLLRKFWELVKSGI